MPDIKVPNYEPSPRQTLFHTTKADEALYGGAAGGGKTAALVAEAVTLALEYPGIPINIFRRTIPELKGTIIPEIYRQCGDYIDAGFMAYHGQDRKFTLSNGSTINLNYCDTDNDVYRYQGTEIPVLMIDELTQFPQSWVEYLKTRNRTSNPNWPVISRYATNPGGVGHGWVKKYFIDIAPHETIYVDSLTKLTRVFIPAKVSDHPLEKFRDDYTKKLNGISDSELRRALLDGDWDVFSGQVFKEFRRDIHVVEPFSIPSHWQRWRSMDYGNNNSVFWFAKDPMSERIYVYREYRTTEFVDIATKSRNIKQFEAGEDVSYGLADPAIWGGAGDHNTGKSVAEMFISEGVNWMPANNDRKAGLAIVHDMLGIAKDGKPKLQIFSTCLSLIRTLPSIPYDKTKVDDVDTHADDHDYDALRYGLMAFVPKKEVVIPKYKPLNFMT